MIASDFEYLAETWRNASFEDIQDAKAAAADKVEPYCLIDWARKVLPSNIFAKLEGRPDSEILAAINFQIEVMQDGEQPATAEAHAAARLFDEIVKDDEPSDDDIKQAAEAMARAAARLSNHYQSDDLAQVFEAVLPCAWPKVGKAGVTVDGLQQRLGRPSLWRRQIRKAALRAAEARAIEAGHVMRGRDAYLSAPSLGKKKRQWQASRDAIEAAKIISACGETLDLAQAVDASIANPKNRLVELIIRAKGMESSAIEAGHVAVFLTVTAPSRYHASRTRYRKTSAGHVYYSEQNPKWAGATPRDGQQHLRRVFDLVRYEAKNAGIHTYGTRTVEPHADGAPHWHMLVYGEPSQLRRYVDLFEARACADDADEISGTVSQKNKHGRWAKVPAKEARFKAVWLDQPKINELTGKPTGGPLAYLLKYLTKNITGLTSDGASIGEDYESGKSAETGAESVRAWASVWGIRQFQTFGDAPVGMWREARRLRGEVIESDPIRMMVEAATASDWHAYRQAAPACELFKITRPEPNQYGEQGAAVVKGIAAQFVKVQTRFKEWSIDWHAGRKAAEAEAARVLTLEGQRPELGFISITVRNDPEPHQPRSSEDGKRSENLFKPAGIVAGGASVGRSALLGSRAKDGWIGSRSSFDYARASGAY